MDQYGPSGYDPSDPERYGPDYLPWGGLAPSGSAGGGSTGEHLPPAAEASPAPSTHNRTARLTVALVAAAALVVGGIGIGYAVQDHGSAVTGTTSDQGSTPGSGSTNPGDQGSEGWPGWPGSQGSQGQGSDGQGSQGNGSQGQGAPTDPWSQGSTTTQGKSQADTAEGKAATAAISPALVNITTTVSYGEGKAAGTGIVLTADGIVVTNHHVIEGATKISAYDVGNGQTYDVKVVGYDSTHDIAVLQLVDASGLTTATIDQDGVQVGDGVVGVGNAGGLGGTPSAAEGKVTALNQSITVRSDSGGTAERLSNLIQTDADIEPGDSGGALVDLQGEVVGVDVAASSNNTTGQGTPEGYAIPVQQALQIADQIRSGAASDAIHIGDTAFLGVQLSADTSGVQVGGVVSGSAAERLGLSRGDVITSVDGARVRSAASLSELIKSKKVGDQITLTWVDAATGKTQQGSATLGAGPVG